MLKYHQFQTTAPIMKSLKGGQFLYKHDIFSHLRHCLIRTWSQTKIDSYFIQSALICIRIREDKLGNCYEFVKNYDTILKHIKEEVRVAVIKAAQPLTHEEFDALDESTPKLSLNVLISMWKKEFSDWKDEEFKYFIDFLKSQIIEFSMQTRRERYLEMVLFHKRFVKIISKIMDNHPELFMPYNQTNHPNVPIAVRVFTYEDRKMVMRSELFKAINMKYPNRRPIEYKDVDGFLYAMELKDVFKNFGDLWHDIEFLITPICKTDQRTVPIITSTGDFCIPGFRAFSEIFYLMSLIMRVFQKVKINSMHVLDDYIKILVSQLEPFLKSQCFITTDAFQKIEQEMCNYWKKFENIPVKDIRDVKRFTLNDLKKELKYLGITEAFPDVLVYADLAFPKLLESVSQNKLETIDMFEAVAECTYCCLLDKYLELVQVWFPQFGSHKMFCSILPPDPVDIFLGVSSSHKDLRRYIKGEDKENMKVKDTSNPQVMKNQRENPKSISKPEGNNSDTPTESGNSSSSKVESSMANCTDCSGVRKEMKTVQNVLKDVQTQLTTMKHKSEKFEKNMTGSVERSKKAEQRLQEEKLDHVKIQVEAKKKLELKLEEVETWKKQVSALWNCKSDHEALNTKLSKCVEKGKKLKEINEKVSNSRDQLSTKVFELKLQLNRELETAETLKNERKDSAKLRNEVNQLKDQLEREREIAYGLQEEASKLRVGTGKDVKRQILESENAQLRQEKQRREMEKSSLLETKMILSRQNEEQHKLIQSLMDQNHTEEGPSNHEDENGSYRKVLWKHQKIKDLYRKGEQQREAEEMVNKLISLNQHPEVQHISFLELESFKKQISDYLHTVEKNIQKIKRNDDFTNLEPLPEPPKMSDKFMRLYWNEMNKQPSTSDSTSSTQMTNNMSA